MTTEMKIKSCERDLEHASFVLFNAYMSDADAEVIDEIENHMRAIEKEIAELS